MCFYYYKKYDSLIEISIVMQGIEYTQNKIKRAYKQYRPMLFIRQIHATLKYFFPRKSWYYKVIPCLLRDISDEMSLSLGKLSKSQLNFPRLRGHLIPNIPQSHGITYK